MRKGTGLSKAPRESDPAVNGVAEEQPTATRTQAVDVAPVVAQAQPQITAPRLDPDAAAAAEPTPAPDLGAVRRSTPRRAPADERPQQAAPQAAVAPLFEPDEPEDGVDGLTAYLPEQLKRQIRTYQGTMAASYDARRYETGRVVVDAFNALAEPTADGMNLDRIMQLARNAEDVSRVGLDRRKPHPNQLVAYHRPPKGKRLRPWQYQAGPELIELLDTISKQTGATQSAVVRVVLTEFMRLREADRAGVARDEGEL
jgi:hypothetical protein